ncbi:MAG TPA: substrate-binding domain-containing protein [Burkholderiaceae bacterium]|nr:substrate-binding domain-containing protein [Burkholderiaceae bacterium]
MPAYPFVKPLAALALLAALAAPAAAQSLRILTAGAFKQVVVALVPVFEAQTGVHVEVSNDTAGALVRRVQGGEAFDLIVLPPGSLETLARDGKVDAASMRPVARVAIGVAVRAGAARPPLETVEQFKEAVLAARKVAYIDPAAGGSSGIYLSGLFQRLGIADAVQAKAVLVPGGLVAERLVSGEADLAIHQISEILPVKGAELVGPLPAAIQNHTTYAVGIARAPRHEAAALAFAAALTGPETAQILRATGMTPAR